MKFPPDCVADHNQFSIEKEDRMPCDESGRRIRHTVVSGKFAPLNQVPLFGGIDLHGGPKATGPCWFVVSKGTSDLWKRSTI